MNERHVRTVLAGIVLVAVLGGIVALSRMRDARQDRTELDTAARTVAEAADGEPFRGPTCSVTEFVRCLRDPAEPDVAARRLQGALSVAAGESAALSCETLPGRTGSRSCTVRLERGRHGVVITVDPDSAREDGRVLRRGSVVRIDAF